MDSQLSSKAKRHTASGISLIELILCLVLVGLFAAMIVPYYKSGVLSSITYTQRQQAIFQLESVLANIIEDYENNYTGKLANFKTELEKHPLPEKYREIKKIDGTSAETITGITVTTKAENIAGGTNNGLKVTLKKTPDITFTYLFVTKEPAP